MLISDNMKGSNFYILTGTLFILAFFYFLFVAENIPAFQEEQFLFLFSGEYLKGFISKPGGLLEYAGKFLMQFYAVPGLAAFELALILILPGILVFNILRKLNPGHALLVPMSMFPSVLLLLMQNQYYHMMEHNLGFICILLYFFFTYRFRKFFLHIVLLPFLFYLTGAFTIIYIVIEIGYDLGFNEGYRKIYEPALLLLTGLLTYIIFTRFLFLIPTKSMLSYPLPFINERFHRIFFLTLTGYFIIFPLSGFSNLFRIPRPVVTRYTGLFSGFFIIIAALLLSGMYDRSISTAMTIQKEAYKGEWDEVIKSNEKFPSGNLISQYFYNTALSEKGMLCDKLFATGQNFGTGALILPWGEQFLERGAYFFYTAGLINEAHRWAYEEMVVYGLRPHNLEMLIKTNLIDGNFRMADKYIRILKQTVFYKDEAEKYEKLLGKRESILSDPELGPVARIIPEKDFFIYMDSPEDNLPLLFESNPANKRAFEYMMSWLLLEKDVETAVSNLHLMKGLGYTSLPRYIEEAVLIYYDSQKAYPEMGGLTVSAETLARFGQYFSAYVKARNNPASLQQTMYEKFGDTFWYYFHFIKPQALTATPGERGGQR